MPYGKILLDFRNALWQFMRIFAVKRDAPSMAVAAMAARGPSRVKENEMTQFHEGQEVEVLIPVFALRDDRWIKATIVRMAPDGGAIFSPVYETTLGLFDAEHIRAIKSRAEIAQDFLKYATLRKGERKRLGRIARGTS